MTMKLFWGDIHSHCSISYGHGTVAQAMARARQQLDFCSITGHAFWPDMPTDRKVYADIIDYHKQGFARLAHNWDQLLTTQAQASDQDFLALPSYEWHSLQFGDHNVYAMGPELPLRDAPDLPALRQWALGVGALVIPHHIGYAAGYRGIDWEHYREEASPFVEIFSLHGCSESEGAPYPMLHDMGPRDAGSTAEAGWARGYRFGIIGSTDHHCAYPGSHGDGRMGVFASALTRESLWEAFQARRVYAATGDRIDARLFVEDAWIGSIIRQPATRHLRVQVVGTDTLDRVEVLKNDRVRWRFFPESTDGGERSSRFRVRITWGWGKREVVVPWQAKLTLSEGSIRAVESCFRGPTGGLTGVSIQQKGHAEVADDVDLPHAIVEQGERSCVWRSRTTGNLSMRHATTQALSLEVDGPLQARVTVEVNGHRFEHSLAELQHAARCHYLRGWLSKAVRIGPAVPYAECCLSAEWEDSPEPEGLTGVDRYRLRVAQVNGQWAWSSPIWVER